MKDMVELLLVVLVSAAVFAPLLALCRARRAESLALPAVDWINWLLAALLLIAFLSLGLFAFVLIYA